MADSIVTRLRALKIEAQSHITKSDQSCNTYDKVHALDIHVYVMKLTEGDCNPNQIHLKNINLKTKYKSVYPTND